MTKNISDIEKCAKLMRLSYKVSGDRVWLQYDTSKREYNPYTNKSDLVDVECALPDICIIMNKSMCIVTVDKDDGTGEEWEATEYFKDHPDKFTARAHAVVAVVEQIYDAKYGGQP